AKILVERIAGRMNGEIQTAERRVSGGWQLAFGREDAHTIVGARLCRRYQKCGLAQIDPAVAALLLSKVIAIGDNRQRVAFERYCREDVYFLENMSRHGGCIRPDCLDEADARSAVPNFP